MIAADGSQLAGECIKAPSFHGEITEEQLQAAECEHLQLINSALSRYKIDLIHFHGLDFHTYLPAQQVLKLATLHLPPSWYPQSIFTAPDLHLNCVSSSQARTAPDGTKLSVVANGVDVPSYRPDAIRTEGLLWIGRVCPEKGVHIALEVAHRAGLPAIVAGPVHPFHDHQLYFSERVQPLLDERRQYVGPVGLKQKRQLLGQASCLLIPSLVAETSSLVAMEAISSGTPVVAFRSGALPEVVEDGLTGFIVESQEEMTQAVLRVSDISRQKCVEVARSRFDAARMVLDYLKLYESLLP